MKFLPQHGFYQASVNVCWKIYRGAELVNASRYNLMSPKSTDTLQYPSFIDNQRFSLSNGTYTLELTVMDNAIPSQIHTHTEKIAIQFSRDTIIYNSDVEVLESYAKAGTTSLLTKNGYDLIPYTINYFPQSQHTLKFYMESYNADSVLGKNTKFVYVYYVENNENQHKYEALHGFQKQRAHPENALLAQLDITNLPSGNYNLVIELKDSINTIRAQKKWFFQRQSNVKENVTGVPFTTGIKTIEDFFNQYQNADSLKEFIECLWPRSTTKEREWQQTQITNKNPNFMRSYLVAYWKAEAGDSLSPLTVWMAYYTSVLEANALLKCGKQKGYYTDRGRVYLQYGKPNQRNQINSEPNSYPYEIWQYYRLYDKATGRFFTNKKFVFANFAIADDCYKLIHSDVRGELYDERWKYRLLNRVQQNQNYDATEPTKVFGNNIDDNFNNPR